MSEWNCPAVSVEAIIFNEQDDVLLIRRGKEPFMGMYAFPGGRMDQGESAEANAARELLEETGLVIDPKNLTLVGVYSAPNRDPRRHNISIAYTGRITGQTPKAGDDAKQATFMPIDPARPMAFDHTDILKDALKKRV